MTMMLTQCREQVLTLARQLANNKLAPIHIAPCPGCPQFVSFNGRPSGPLSHTPWCVLVVLSQSMMDFKGTCLEYPCQSPLPDQLQYTSARCQRGVTHMFPGLLVWFVSNSSSTFCAKAA